MGRFYCRTEKKSLPLHILKKKKKKIKFTANFKFSSVPVTSFDKRLND
jgi:hypothetical protein